MQTRNRLLLLLALALLAGGATVYLVVKSKKPISTLGNEAHSFAVQDTAGITRIFIADRNGHKVTVDRKSKGLWQVDGQFAARPELVQLVLETAKGLEVSRPVPARSRNTVIKTMATSNTKVELYAGTELVKSYFLGPPTQDQLGTFMLLEGSEEPFILHLPGLIGFLNPRYPADPMEWRNRSLLGLPDSSLKQIHVSFVDRATEGYSVVRTGPKTAELQQDMVKYIRLSPPAPLLLGYLHGWASLQVEYWLNSKHVQDSLLATRPLFLVSATATTGKQTVLKLFAKAKAEGAAVPEGMDLPTDIDRMWVVVQLPNGSRQLGAVQHRLIDPLLVPLEAFNSMSERASKQLP